MKKHINCLSYRQFERFNKQSKKKFSWVKRNLLFRQKRIKPDKMWSALMHHSNVICKIRLRANGNMVNSALDRIWMIREGNKIYSALRNPNVLATL